MQETIENTWEFISFRFQKLPEASLASPSDLEASKDLPQVSSSGSLWETSRRRK